MGIQSSKNQKSPKRIIQAQSTPKDIQEYSLRPKTLKNYIGQKMIKKQLSIAILSAKKRKVPLEHILLYGPPGLGKTTLSNIIALEMQANLKISSGPAIEKQSDIVSILSNIEQGDILFIDEIHRLRPQVEEILYTAMEDFVIDIMVGKGTGAQSVRMPIKPFTLIGATTKLSSLSSPLRDRFGNILKLDFYDENDLVNILKNNTSLLGISHNDDLLIELAKRSRGTPRIANRLLKILRDYEIIGKDISLKEVYDEIFLDLDIDDIGLDYLDKKYLFTLQEKFAGGPVGLSTLASSIGEEEATLEDVVEPYLLQIGFLEKSSRGRKVTNNAILHLNK